MGINKLLLAFFALAGTLAAQNPQTQTAPAQRMNVLYTNGVGPGYWPQAGSGLTLNVGKGTVNCANTIVAYAGGTLTMANNTTNYVYLDTASSCAPGSNTSGFISTTIPIATVVTASGVITTITDDRTPFSSSVAGASTLNGVSYPASPSLHSVPVITATNTATYKVVPSCLDSVGNHLNYDWSTDTFSCGNTGPTPSNGVVPPTPRRWAYLSSVNVGVANTFYSVGDFGQFANCNADYAINSTFPTPALDCTNGTTSGNGEAAMGGRSWFVGNNLLFIAKVRMASIVTLRYWVYMSDVNAASMWGSATPGGNYAGFRFDTTAGDTNYQCKSSGNTGSTVTTTNSGVAADTNFHVFKIVEVSATPSFKFYIDGTLVCTHTTNIPPAGTALNNGTAASTQAAVATHLYPAWLYEESDQ